MRVRTALSALAAAGVLAGCGSSDRIPSAASLPLVPGSSVLVKMRECNRGKSAFCATEMVVRGAGFASPRRFLFAERDYLKAHGWSGADPDTGVELAAESPGDKLRVTYATALQDLKGIDLDWIARPGAIEAALDHAVFIGVPTMSMLLEVGSH